VGRDPPIAAAQLARIAWWALPVTVVIVLAASSLLDVGRVPERVLLRDPYSHVYSPCLSAKCLHVRFG